MTAPGNAAPLQGIKVVELTSVVLGPYACQMLGDLGAEVVKIEPPGGDTNRNLGPHRNNEDMCSLFLTCNRNKRSVGLNMKTADGLAAARALIKDADVLVHNFRPQAIEKLGLGYSAVSELNPDIIYCGAYGFPCRAPTEKRVPWTIPYRPPVASPCCKAWWREIPATCLRLSVTRPRR